MFKFGTFILILMACVNARATLCNPLKERCWGHSSHSSTKPAYPSSSSSIHINPSAVPTEDAFGIETLMYKGQYDFGIVKGTGRIGAALSASNGEETFFGPPGFEIDTTYLERKIEKKKYVSQKLNLATSFNVISNGRQGLSRFEINLGVAAKYNRLSKKFLPGGGISGIAGPITFGYSGGKDQNVLDLTSLGIPEPFLYNYNTTTYSAGVYLDAFAFDYSRLQVKPEAGPESIITLLTGSLLLQRWIITVATRTEKSPRPYYDPKTQTLLTQEVKKSAFGGLQFSLTKVLMIGAFYNYYLLNDVSLGVTLFF